MEQRHLEYQQQLAEAMDVPTAANTLKPALRTTRVPVAQETSQAHPNKPVFSFVSFNTDEPVSGSAVATAAGAAAKPARRLDTATKRISYAGSGWACHIGFCVHTITSVDPKTPVSSSAPAYRVHDLLCTLTSEEDSGSTCDSA